MSEPSSIQRWPTPALHRVNVGGVFNMSKAFVPSMIAREAGVIVNLASIGGVTGIRDRIAYCSTKFAVVGITKSMALDHATDGIRVNCICPGGVETPFVAARLKEYPDPEKAYREMSATQALGRMGKPEEIAAAALYLASDEAAFVTGGKCFLIDGGWLRGSRFFEESKCESFVASMGTGTQFMPRRKMGSQCSFAETSLGSTR